MTNTVTRRRLVRLVITAALGLVGPLWCSTGTPAAGARTWTYVANDFYVVGPDLAASVVDSTTGVGTAPLGSFRFVAEHESIVLTVDDAGARAGNGMVQVWVSGSGRRCIPAGTPVRFDGLRPGQVAGVYVDDVSYAIFSGCTSTGGTAGTVTVVP